ncbi:hypothetical protein O6P43_003561 [Quillaja saponaria]|uniref:Uncharacterized protein n=1 Tax=Quillaja saponaria TaxID=32244 RepID=A0AAD7VLE7_QUISA|nr:hypothetical protein O6P43_003561 [Quillaja saponaria]
MKQPKFILHFKWVANLISNTFNFSNSDLACNPQSESRVATCDHQDQDDNFPSFLHTYLSTKIPQVQIIISTLKANLLSPFFLFLDK